MGDGAALLEERDVIRDPLDRREVAELARRAGGLDAILATRSPAYRQRADEDNDEARWIAAMVEEPRLIRRPILETDGGLSVGFSADGWRRLLKSPSE